MIGHIWNNTLITWNAYYVLYKNKFYFVISFHEKWHKNILQQLYNKERKTFVFKQTVSVSNVLLYGKLNS